VRHRPEADHAFDAALTALADAEALVEALGLRHCTPLSEVAEMRLQQVTLRKLRDVRAAVATLHRISLG